MMPMTVSALRPTSLRSSCSGADAHARKVVMSWECMWSVPEVVETLGNYWRNFMWTRAARQLCA